MFTHDSHTHVGPLYLKFTLNWAHRRNPRFSILPKDTRAARDWTANLPNSRWPALAEIPVFLCTTGTCKVHLKPSTSQTAASIDKHATLCLCHTFTFKIQKIPLAVNFIEDNNEHTDLWPARKTVQCAWLQTAAALYPGQKQPAQCSRSVNLFLEHTAAIMLRIKSPQQFTTFLWQWEKFCLFFVFLNLWKTKTAINKQLKTNKQSYSLFL